MSHANCADERSNFNSVLGEKSFGGKWQITRAAIASMFLLSGVIFGSWAVRIPEVQQTLNLSNQSLGFALLASAIGALLAMPFAGWLTTVIGSTRLTTAAAIAYAVSLPIISTAPGFRGLALILLSFGALGNVLNIAINTQASLLEQKVKLPIMSSFHGLYSFGGMIGAVIGAALVSFEISLQIHYLLISGLLIALALFVASRLLPHSQDVPQIIEQTNRSSISLKSLTSNYSSLFFLGLVCFCVMFGEGAMSDWSAVYFKQELGAAESFAAAGYASFSLAMAVGRLSGDVLRTRFGSFYLLRGGAGLAAVSLVISLLFPSSVVSLIAFAGVGLGFSNIVPLVYSSAGQKSEMSSGVALSIVSSIGYFGFLFGPPIIGYLAEHTSLRIALATIPLLCILMITLAPKLKGE